MNPGIRLLAALAVMTGVVGLFLASRADAQGESQRLRPGLTAQQTKEAVELARGAMHELRQKTEGASEPEADPREYVVNVELLNAKDEAPENKKASGEKAESKPDTKPERLRAVVTSYRYFDDITVFSTIDLHTGKVVDVQAAQHIPTPLSDGEYDEAVVLARERSDEVRKLYERFGDQLKVYPQFSQFTVKDDPRRHRVVHLNYRVGKRDLSYPRPQINLTTREITIPAPEAEPRPPVRRRDGGN